MNSKENKVKKVKRKYKSAKVFIGLAAILGITCAISILLAFLSAYKSETIVPTSTTNTILQGNSLYAIGQACQYNYECPQKAYCKTTCQCPDQYYENQFSGNCTRRQTFNTSCTSNYQCNHIVGLFCINNVCTCNTLFQFWNGTYIGGNGIQQGRCQSLKVHGMACSGNDGAYQITYGTWFGAQTTR